MAREIIYKGEDKVIRLTISQDGTPLDLSEFNGILVILYSKATDREIAKFSLNEREGYDEIALIDAGADGVLEINLQADDTRYAENGDVDAEIKVQQEDLDFSNDTFHTISRGIAIGEMRNSITKLIDDL